MPRLKHMQVGAIDPHRFRSVIGDEDYRALLALIDRAANQLRDRVVWNVNSTYRGGGVAELLRSLLGYARGAGVDARWVVIRGERGFFTATKRLHNQLHGFGAGGELDEGDRRTYTRTLAANASDLVPLLRPSDVVILHDPQTAGMVDAVKASGATAIWRCHVGLDRPNEAAREAWRRRRHRRCRFSAAPEFLRTSAPGTPRSPAPTGRLDGSTAVPNWSRPRR